jgi:hypothetical protein
MADKLERKEKFMHKVCARNHAPRKRPSPCHLTVDAASRAPVHGATAARPLPRRLAAAAREEHVRESADAHQAGGAGAQSDQLPLRALDARRGTGGAEPV